MGPELRNSIWNVLHIEIWSKRSFLKALDARYVPGVEGLSTHLWFHHFKLPIDRRPSRPSEILEAIRSYFRDCSWNEVYDFVECVVDYYAKSKPELSKILNGVLEREMSAYRLIDGHVVDITGEQERTALEEALADTRFGGVSAHLARALELLADRSSPDPRNSIKESISAVEAMARVVSGDPKATLGEALKALEKSGKLHAALKDGFSKLYGYTSDASGIRHAMLDAPNLTQADAKYFLLSCTSFVNYLKASMA